MRLVHETLHDLREVLIPSDVLVVRLFRAIYHILGVKEIALSDQLSVTLASELSLSLCLPVRRPLNDIEGADSFVGGLRYSDIKV